MSRDASSQANGTIPTGSTIEVPPVEGLSVAQTCGRACVWCAVVLTTENAVELGTRSERRFDTDFVWFPRGCRLCAEPHAYGALLDHIQSCEQCNDETGRCAEGKALRQALKEVRR
ncbi:hypothetical protein OG453_33610 [Streptomyces sp. NBC_01381]|uniref:hypothetical protein n=1 Tax=Streptomyces sp. NBC_01381 TaxID=2903845 RepID=UPI00224E8896|nr:hypothetical protein [Streptomyces sp. NBC_01381]MCX4671570.1 hypothetical protein [Streptomyces sp. NBC_01381]